MKNKIKYTFLGSLFLLFGLLTLILFLTLPEKRLSSAVFWVSFSFSIPANYIVLSAFSLWGFGKKGDSFIRLPISTVISILFAGIYLLVGILFMYLPVENTTFPIVIFSIITVAFVIIAAFSINGANYIHSSETIVKQKRLFIKMLEADVLDCVAMANANTAELLQKFAEDVRFSDPMSHQSLDSIESKLSSTVSEISGMLNQDPNADISAMIEQASSLLKSRNNRCLMLK